MKENMREVFSGTSLEEFLKIQNTLRENQIDCSRKSRLSDKLSSFFVRLFAFGKGGGINSREEHRQDYHIFVKEVDYERAISIIKNIQ